MRIERDINQGKTMALALQVNGLCLGKQDRWEEEAESDPRHGNTTGL
jgi:hypothetical protein